MIRTCVELGDANPIVSIHDQGAGGSGNVLKARPAFASAAPCNVCCGHACDPCARAAGPSGPCGARCQQRWGWLYRQEIVEPLGATIDVDKFIVGDPTMSVLEIWGAE